jgi:hydroxymethylpyrimidine/phosphomethylpyrimidine kinase
VLVGNHSTLWRWLLARLEQRPQPHARDIARAAAEMGVPYTLVTGIPLPEQFVENVLASPQTVLGSVKFELFDATFSGAGDTLSAALTALVASGSDLGEATSEALSYLDRCLDAGFRPGMGHMSFPIACSGPSPMMKMTMKTNPLTKHWPSKAL